MEDSRALAVQIGAPPSYLQVRVILDRGNNDFRYESVSIDTGNQGESLMLQLKKIRDTQTTGLYWILKTVWDALNMRQDAIWLVSASLVSNSTTKVAIQP